MKNLILLLGVFAVFSCKAQQTLPLNTVLDNIPQGAHVKDLNNELNPYIGIYKATYQGNEITLYITKEENKLEKRIDKQFYRDALVIKYIVKNSNGLILQDTQNFNNPNNKLHSIKIRGSQNIVDISYSGTNCRIGWGSIKLKKLNANQFSWDYQPNSSVINSATCPPGTDKTVYLPDTDNLIFTKQ